MSKESKVVVNKNTCTLFLKNIKLVASNPSIQPFNEYHYENQDDIMYFYYDLKLYRSTHCGWQKIASSYVTECGIMPHIARNIDELIKIDTKKEGIRHYFTEKDSMGNDSVSKTDYEAVFPYTIADMFYEDALCFSKHFKTFTDIRGNQEFQWYDLNIFIGGNSSGATPIGCHVTHLDDQDLSAIKEFAEKFMELAGNRTKEAIENALNNDTEDEFNTPKIVRDYLKNTHNIDDWRPIFLKLNREEYVIDEFIEYITGKKTINELECNEWHGQQRTMREMLKTMKDYEAYLYIIDDNRP